MGKAINISVVMSVYKEPIDWISQSIDSILEQSYSDFEFIIVCDNPDYQECLALLNKYAKEDDRVKLIINDYNIGLTKSLNKALNIAKGVYIARMDADDISLPDRFEKQISFMESKPEIDVCGTNIKFIGNKSFFSEKIKKFPVLHEDILMYMFFDNPFAHSSVMMRRVIGGAPVSYDESISKAQDYKLWYDIFKQGGKFANLGKVCLEYRISKCQISSNGNKEQQGTADIVRGNMIRSFLPTITTVDVEIHNETCKIIKTGIRIEDKLDWLKRLTAIGIIGKSKDNVSLMRYFKVWYENCYQYGRYDLIKAFPNYNWHLLMNRMFIRFMVKSFARRIVR